MRMLVLGGTAWLGSAIAANALARGHEVTCVARGTSGPVPDGATLITANRDSQDAYDGLTGHWDAVFDVARQPGHVRRAVAALEPVASRYVFVSTANVYADQRTLGQDEDAPLLDALEADVMPSMEFYGQAKVAGEQAVRATFGPERRLVARAGLIGGPDDPSGRTGYWPWRFARPSNPDGAVLVPDAPGLLKAIIDVRDLAAWLVECAEQGRAGTFNAMGTPGSLGETLELARRVAGGASHPVAAPADWLTSHGVAEWSGPKSLPLWLADPDWVGMNARTNARALAAGLRLRPLEETFADTLAAELARPEPGPHGAGLTDAEERELLAAFAAEQR